MKYIKTYETMNELSNILKKSEDILTQKFSLLVHIWGSINHEATINFHLEHSIKKEKLEPIINYFKDYDWKIEGIGNTGKFKIAITVPIDFLLKLA